MLRVRYVKNTARPVQAAVPSNGNVATLLDESQTFHMGAIRVDNYSGKWLRIDSEGIYIPPFTAGYVVDVYVQTQRLRLLMIAPPSMIGNQINDGEVIVSVYDDVQQPDTGTFVGYAQTQVSDVAYVGTTPYPPGTRVPTNPTIGTVLDFGYNIATYWHASASMSGVGLSDVRVPQVGLQHVVPVGPTALVGGGFNSLPTDGNPWSGVTYVQFMGFSFSVDVSNLIQFRWSGVPTPFFKHYVMAMTPYTLLMPAQGLPYSGAGQSFQVQPDVNCNIVCNFMYGP